MENLQNYIDKLNKLNFKEMYEGDFFLTWEKSSRPSSPSPTPCATCASTTSPPRFSSPA